MSKMDATSKVNLRFVGREVLNEAPAGAGIADGVLGAVVDVSEHSAGVGFYVMAEAFTAGQVDFEVETADDASFTQNVELLTADHYIEHQAIPVSLSAAQVAGANAALRIGFFASRRFVRLRRSATAANGAQMTLVAAILMAPDIEPTGALNNQ